MRTTARTAAVLLTTSLVIGGTAATAHAQATTVKDKTSDVVTYSDADQDGTLLSYSDSVASGADVRSLKVDHSKKSVTLTYKFAELGPDTTISAAFRVNGKKRPAFGLIGTSLRKAAVYNLKGKKVCSARVTAKTGTKGSVKVVVKRSCLKNPKKIQVAADASALDSSADTYSVHYDAVSKNSVRTATWTKSLKSS